MPKKNNLDKNIERRRYKRLRKKFTMRYCPAEEDFNLNLMSDAEILDISGGGIRFMALEKLKKNTQLLIKLPLNDWGKDKNDWMEIFAAVESRELMIIGKVMWSAAGSNNSKSYETGIRFIGRIEPGKGDNL